MRPPTRLWTVALTLSAVAACQTHGDPEKNDAADITATQPGTVFPQEDLEITTTLTNEFVETTSVLLTATVADATMFEFVGVAHEPPPEGLYEGKPSKSGLTVYMDALAGEKQKSTWKYKCLRGGMTTITFDATWTEYATFVEKLLEPDSQPDNTLVKTSVTKEIVCADDNVGTGGETGDDDDDDSTGTGDDDDDDDTGDSGDTGVATEIEPVHLYMPRDDQEFVFGYRLDLEEDVFEELPGSPWELPEAARAAGSTNDGAAVFFGGSSLTAHARDPLTGALTKVGTPIPLDITADVIEAAADDSRIFVAGNFSMSSTDLTMYGIEPDYSLTQGATFTVGLFPRRMATDASASTLFAPFNEEGLFVATLGAFDEMPTPVATSGDYGPANELEVTSDGACMFMPRSPGLSGVGLRAYSVGADNDPVEVDRYDEGYAGRVLMAPDDRHVLASIGGALEVLPINDDCTFGEPTGAVPEWPVPTRYSNLMPYGDGALLFRFDSNARAEPIVLDVDGNLEVGPELEIQDAVFQMVALSEG